MKPFEQYDEISRYFAAGKLKDVADVSNLTDMNIGEYLNDKYALWLDFTTIDKNKLHGTGRRVENASEGITLQIEKKAETAGNLNAYIHLIMDAQLNIKNGEFVSYTKWST